MKSVRYHTIMPHRSPIVVAFASAGSGHRVAAQAIAASLERLAPSTPIELIDILAMSGMGIDGDAATDSFSGPFAPLYDAVWGDVTMGRLVWGPFGWIPRSNFRSFTRRIRELQPAAVVCTHTLPANILTGPIERLRAPRPIICVPTDYGLHGYWPIDLADLFCVGSEGVREDFIAQGGEARHAIVTGIPVRPGFGPADDRPALRRELGIDVDGVLAVALVGAGQVGPYRQMKRVFADALPRLSRIEGLFLLVVTGNDEEYAAELAAVVGHDPRVRIAGFVEEMDRVFSAADFAICKAGGLVVTEAICSELPLVTIGRAAGQERANVDWLAAVGAGVHASTDGELIAFVDRLVESEELRERMRGNARAVALPDAADRVARITLIAIEAAEAVRIRD